MRYNCHLLEHSDDIVFRDLIVNIYSLQESTVFHEGKLTLHLHSGDVIRSWKSFCLSLINGNNQKQQVYYFPLLKKLNTTIVQSDHHPPSLKQILAL
jgi:hypothetical protein